MRAHLHLHECLHAQPQPFGRHHGAGTGHDASLFQPLPPAARLAGREIEPLAQFLRGQLRVVLNRLQEASIGIVQNGA
jgi:hypothetical protein